MKVLRPLIVFPLIIFFLSSCLVTSQLTRLTDVGPNQVVLVGKIVLDPPLHKQEQELSFTIEGYRNQVVFLLDDEVHPSDVVDFGLIEKSYRVNFGETFYLVVDKSSPLFFSAPMYFLTDSEMAYMPGGLAIEIPEGAKSVYIGTILYKRNHYNEIEDVEFVNEYDSAQSEYIERFGTGPQLVPAKLSIVDVE